MGKNRIFVSTELGEFFRSARKERGLSQLELSAEIGVHQGIISNIERGAYQQNQVG
ncbi:helix-turn-helix domain-containing protein [Laceyella tengchongensis]|uniref:helix-turn-helix domain-containing protein n=1 Tax=Laceyella tengchongensis TaxID=574699 RepID=UPI0012B84BAA|nr:helix-turn-helix domain-containing protein [Laceyella tengchongensis]